MANEHSPGPWRWYGDFRDRPDDKGYLLDADEETITRLDYPRPSDADARLIAAAPSLLEALEMCALAFERNDCVDWGEVRALITRVRRG
jgi:hypothetical protein